MVFSANIHVPAVDWDRTAREVLTLEWIDGAPLSDLERVADYITFIHKGRIVFSSGKDEVLDKWREIFPDPRIEYFEDAGHYVLEDAAESLGSTYRDLPAGAMAWASRYMPPSMIHTPARSAWAISISVAGERNGEEPQ